MKLLPSHTPLEKAIKKMNTKDFRQIVKKLERQYGKEELRNIRIKVRFEVRQKDGRMDEEGIIIEERYGEK